MERISNNFELQPLNAAMCRADFRPLLKIFTLAPLSINRFTIASWPRKYVQHLKNLMFINDLDARDGEMEKQNRLVSHMYTWNQFCEFLKFGVWSIYQPDPDAVDKAVLPYSSGRSTSIPLLINKSTTPQ